MSDRVIIAGGGIGGLTMALTLHQIGVACTVIESSPEMLALGEDSIFNRMLCANSMILELTATIWML